MQHILIDPLDSSCCSALLRCPCIVHRVRQTHVRRFLYTRDKSQLPCATTRRPKFELLILGRAGNIRMSSFQRLCVVDHLHTCNCNIHCPSVAILSFVYKIFPPTYFLSGQSTLISVHMTPVQNFSQIL